MLIGKQSSLCDWCPSIHKDLIANCNIFYDSLISREKIYAWIIELSSPETREAALLELSKKREVEKISDQTVALPRLF